MHKIAKDKNIQIDNDPDHVINDLECLQLYLHYQLKEGDNTIEKMVERKDIV